MYKPQTKHLIKSEFYSKTKSSAPPAKSRRRTTLHFYGSLSISLYFGNSEEQADELMCTSYSPAGSSAGTFLAAADSFIRLLSVMRLPPAFCDLHIGKYRFKGRVLRRTCVDAEPDLPVSLMHMADPHLAERDPVRGTLDAVIILSPAETIPHGFYGCADLCGSPVRIPVVGHHASQMLELVIFIFN